MPNFFIYFPPPREWDTGRIISYSIGHSYAYRSKLEKAWSIESYRYIIITDTASCRATMVNCKSHKEEVMYEPKN